MDSVATTPDSAAMVEFVDLVALRPIRRKDGTKAVRMADGALLEIVPVKFVCGYLGDGKWRGEGHPHYLWRMGFVIALLNAGYKVISAENHVLAVTKLSTDVSPLSKRRLLAEAINARVAIDNALSEAARQRSVRVPEGGAAKG